MSDLPKPGMLYVAATPIGNLEDVTLRCLRVLKEVDVIAAEDTRHTRKLLSHFDIHTPMVSCHDHSTPAEREKIIQRLLQGRDVALVTDAGTPGVSDPGTALMRDALSAGVVIVPLPGASALLTALVGSGLPMDRFRFAGFLPRKGADRKLAIAAMRAVNETTVIYEAPQRVAKTIRDLADALGYRPACAARELTKIHEEFIRAPLPEIGTRLPDPLRGEWTLVIGGATESTEPAEALADWHEELRLRLEAGESRRDASRAVAESHGVSRKETYAAALGWEG